MSEKIKTWYRIAGWSKDQIEAVPVIKETESCIVLSNGRRRNKYSGWESFFPTPEAAKQHAINSTLQNIEAYERNLASARERLNKIQAIDLQNIKEADLCFL
jgi:hypothetical protein